MDGVCAHSQLLLGDVSPEDKASFWRGMPRVLGLFALSAAVLAAVLLPMLQLSFAVADDWHYLEHEDLRTPHGQFAIQVQFGRPIAAYLYNVLSRMTRGTMTDFTRYRLVVLLEVAATAGLLAAWLMRRGFPLATSALLSLSMAMAPALGGQVFWAEMAPLVLASPVALAAALCICDLQWSDFQADRTSRRQAIVRLAVAAALLAASLMMYPANSMVYFLPFTLVLLFTKPEQWTTARFQIVLGVGLFLAVALAYFLSASFIREFVFKLPVSDSDGHKFALNTALSDNVAKFVEFWVHISFRLSTLWFGCFWRDGVSFSYLVMGILIAAAGITAWRRLREPPAAGGEWAVRLGLLEGTAAFGALLMLSCLHLLLPKGEHVAYHPRMTAGPVCLLVAALFWALLVVLQTLRLRVSHTAVAGVLLVLGSVATSSYNTHLGMNNAIEFAFLRSQLESTPLDRLKNVLVIQPDDPLPPPAAGGALYTGRCVMYQAVDARFTTANWCPVLLHTMTKVALRSLGSEKEVIPVTQTVFRPHLVDKPDVIRIYWAKSLAEAPAGALENRGDWAVVDFSRLTVGVPHTPAGVSQAPVHGEAVAHR